jgi:hypothetical protein
MFSTAFSSWTSETSLVLTLSSSSRSRSLSARARRSFVSSRIVRASAAVVDRNRASSSSAAWSRIWNWPRARRASARSNRSFATRGPSSTSVGSVPLSGRVFLGGLLPAVEERDACFSARRAAFSASRTAMRSASWEPSGGVGGKSQQDSNSDVRMGRIGGGEAWNRQASTSSRLTGFCCSVSMMPARNSSRQSSIFRLRPGCSGWANVVIRLEWRDGIGWLWESGSKRKLMSLFVASRRWMESSDTCPAMRWQRPTRSTDSNSAGPCP